MRVAVIGSRQGVSSEAVANFMRRLAEKHPDAVIVSGGARGVDRLAVNYAEQLGLPTPHVIPAEWERDGRKDPLAGKRRNWEIVKDADEVVAFWDGWSNGTAHAVTAATTLGKRAWVYTPMNAA